MTDAGGRRLVPRTGWGRFLAVAILLPIAGLFGVAIADALPDRLVMDRLADAIGTGDIVTDNYPTGTTGARLDRHSECKRMTIGLGDEPAVGTIESAIRSPTLGSCPGMVARVNGWVDGDGLVRAYEYSRYWSGSVIAFRVGLLLVGVAGMRMVAAVALFGAVLWAWHRLSRTSGSAVAVVGLAPLVLSTDFVDLPGALLHAIAWIVILVSVALVSRLPDDADRWTIVTVLFLVGAAFLYLADMTNPPASWALATGVLGITGARTLRGRALLVRVVVGGGAWVAGFAWMWASKWGLAAAVYGVGEMADEVSGQIDLRLNAAPEGAPPPGFLDGLRLTWGAWWDVPLTGPVVAAVVIGTIWIVSRRGMADLAATWADRVVLSLPALIPPVWLMLLRNHTQIHFWFVYRSLPAALAVLAMAWCVRLERPRRV